MPGKARRTDKYKRGPTRYKDGGARAVLIETAFSPEEVIAAANKINARTARANRQKRQEQRRAKSPRHTPTLPKLNLPPMPEE